MADIRSQISRAFLKEGSDALVAVGVILVVMMLIIPLPAIILDTLQSSNLVLSLLILLIVLYTVRALDFSIFPTILLVSTVLSLALNISSTRLILSKGGNFDGRIVRAFGSFVTGSSGTEGLVIGIIIYIIIIAVQFLVITKGATRVAEVAARFTLDSLPGKQMAIDAEYSNGSISEQEAQHRKRDLQKEVDFYGAMDGASKFVQGNVTVGILITIVNIVGGLLVGLTIHGETLTEAVNTYVSLTIGDGLVSQFPSLLVSTATGLIVTRAVSDGSFGQDLARQFARQDKIYWIAAVFLLLLALLPGFPWYVLIPLAALSIVMAFRLGRSRKQSEEKTAAVRQEPADTSRDFPKVAPLDPVSLELGYGLVPLVDKEQGAELLERITKIRREIVLDLGLIVPRIRIIDNMRLEPSEYCLKIRGVEVGRGLLRMDHFLCINPGGVKTEIEGEKTTDPAFGLPAIWVSERDRDRAERAGYTVVDPPSIIATHLTELIKRNSANILGRQEVKSLLDGLREDYSAVVEEVRETLGLGDIQKVLQGLLKEQVSIRNMVSILETLADFAKVAKDDIPYLIEKVRQGLARQICLQYADDEKIIHVITLQPELEQEIIESRQPTAAGPIPALPPEVQRLWVKASLNTVRKVQEMGYLPIVLTQEISRVLVKTGLRRDIPELVVLSVPEIISEVNVESLGTITLKGTAESAAESAAAESAAQKSATAESAAESAAAEEKNRRK